MGRVEQVETGLVVNLQIRYMATVEIYMHEASNNLSITLGRMQQEKKERKRKRENIRNKKGNVHVKNSTCTQYLLTYSCAGISC
jgi:hypothetical protein